MPKEEQRPEENQEGQGKRRPIPMRKERPNVIGESREGKPEKSVRLQRREARMEFVRKAREPRKIRVTPARDELRGLLKHPNGGGFRSTGSVEWPLDSFTRRRIQDGDVTVEERDQNQPEDEPQTEGGTAQAQRAPRSGGTDTDQQNAAAEPQQAEKRGFGVRGNAPAGA